MNTHTKNEPRTWSVQLLYMAGALTVVETNLERYRISIMEIQEVRWIGDGNLKLNNITVFIVVVKDMKEVYDLLLTMHIYHT
ncbi:craniofacial development protein 2-like [Aphis craccivora]|uniref:Craniofacial development protein 2-like n=1 Tax=Aphis craccivora TaxID=307492 RepID=A0A6G0YV65_APHCR|nr:craniofacial development protein 2-like [Aphis craccivora]